MTPGEAFGYVTWQGKEDSVWDNKANWDVGFIPDISMSVTIPKTDINPVVLSPDAACSELTVNSQASLTIAPSGVLRTEDFIYGHSNTDPTGLIVAADSMGAGSFIFSDISPAADVTVQCYLPGQNKTHSGWYLFADPLGDQQIVGSDLDPASGEDSLYIFDESAHTWVKYGEPEFQSTYFGMGTGYLIYSRYKGVKNLYGFAVAAKPEEGGMEYDLNYTPSAVGPGWNLIGNPFLSSVSWDSVYVTGDAVDATIYTLNPDGKFVSYNKNTHTGDFDGIIPSTQSFFVHAEAPGQKVNMVTKDQVPNRCQHNKAQKDVAENSLQVKVSGDSGSDKTYIQFIKRASTAFDPAWDGYKLFGFSNVPEIYTTNDTDLFSINALPFDINHYDLPLGVKCHVDGLYSLTFTGIDSLKRYDVTLEDRQTLQNTPVKEGTVYHFSYKEGDNPLRFVLHFSVITGIRKVAHSKFPVRVYVWHKRITLKTTNGKPLNGQMNIYDLNGRRLVTRELNPGLSESFDLPFKRGLYLVQVISNHLSSHTEKVLVW
jgi:hypothetical protein